MNVLKAYNPKNRSEKFTGLKVFLVALIVIIYLAASNVIHFKSEHKISKKVSQTEKAR